jgi:beta-lactam-binding protein with PASTA domain
LGKEQFPSRHGGIKISKFISVFKFITHRPLWLNILVGFLLAIGIFSVFILSLKWITHHNTSKTVPYVTGKSFEEAERILEKAGFEIEIQDSIYTDTTKPGQVLKQFPEADEVVKVNRTVYLTINRAVPPMVEMPNLVGFSFRNAEMTLKNNNLRFGDTVIRTDFARAVLEQLYKGSPIAPGTKIRMGSKIDFVIGSGVGSEEFLISDFTGLTYRQAKARLESNGLGVGALVLEPDVVDTLDAFVYKQNPERFDEEKKIQKIRTGQTIDLWLQVEKPVKDSTNVPLPQ